jgi:hypothetical protein
MIDEQRFSICMEILHNAIQKLYLLPMAEMQAYLECAMNVAEAADELTPEKRKAAIRQLELIRAAKEYRDNVKAIMRSDPG